MIGALGAVTAALIGFFKPDPTPTSGPQPPPTAEPSSTRSRSDESSSDSTTSGDPTASKRPSTSAKERWRGPVTLPLSLNVPSQEGIELDTAKPVRAGVDDDLRGDYQTSPKIVVLSGHAAEIPGDADGLTRSACEKRLTSSVPKGPVWIDALRGNGMGGTYCFNTTEGRVAAFSIVSADPMPLPQSITLKVVLWG
ncbi:hypothetical protein [Streptomyces cinnamoneus]|uniref:hypothetical protein n=1 Tax=Streptomyces cinnamoneus TaxID=53446 RepID=UPI00167EB534|nr:hypothetical protein [Streptomyces cinnamoneus]